MVFGYVGCVVLLSSPDSGEMTMPEDLLDTLPPPNLTSYERMQMNAEMDRVIKILSRVHSARSEE